MAVGDEGYWDSTNADESEFAYLDNREEASTRITQRRGIDVIHGLSNGAGVYSARMSVVGQKLPQHIHDEAAR